MVSVKLCKVKGNNKHVAGHVLSYAGLLAVAKVETVVVDIDSYV